MNVSSKTVTWVAYATTSVALLALPLFLESFWVGEFGKYLAFGLVAIGIVPVGVTAEF